MDGVFGWGDDPRKDPCHMQFYEEAERWLTAFAAQKPDRDAAFAVVRFVLEAPAARRESHCYWFLYAAHGLIRELIPMLDADQCARLRDYYDAEFPKRDRLPVQKDVYKRLKKGAR